MAILVHLPALCIDGREEYGTFHGQSGTYSYLILSLISLWQQFNTILTWKYISTDVTDELNEERTLLIKHCQGTNGGHTSTAQNTIKAAGDKWRPHSKAMVLLR